MNQLQRVDPNNQLTWGQIPYHLYNAYQVIPSTAKDAIWQNIENVGVSAKRKFKEQFYSNKKANKSKSMALRKVRPDLTDRDAAGGSISYSTTKVWGNDCKDCKPFAVRGASKFEWFGGNSQISTDRTTDFDAANYAVEGRQHIFNSATRMSNNIPISNLMFLSHVANHTSENVFTTAGAAGTTPNTRSKFCITYSTHRLEIVNPANYDCEYTIYDFFANHTTDSSIDVKSYAQPRYLWYEQLVGELNHAINSAVDPIPATDMTGAPNTNSDMTQVGKRPQTGRNSSIGKFWKCWGVKSFTLSPNGRHVHRVKNYANYYASYDYLVEVNNGEKFGAVAESTTNATKIGLIKNITYCPMIICNGQLMCNTGADAGHDTCSYHIPRYGLYYSFKYYFGGAIDFKYVHRRYVINEAVQTGTKKLTENEGGTAASASTNQT